MIITVQIFIEISDLARNESDDFVQRFEIETYFQLSRFLSPTNEPFIKHIKC